MVDDDGFERRLTQLDLDSKLLLNPKFQNSNCILLIPLRGYMPTVDM